MKLRFMLLRENGYEVERAQKCLDFIHGGIEEAPAQSKAEELADGIYLIDTKGNAVRFVGDKTETINDTAYVGIVMGSHSVAVSLIEQAQMDDITLTKKDANKCAESIYHTKYIDAVADWNGKRNTENLKKQGLNSQIELRPGEYIPSLAELYLICLNRKKLNEALEFVGGQLLGDLWYWSSTEYSATNAWSLGLNYGTASYTTKATDKYRVRAVSAFLPLNR
jgi:hypothetical protein